MKMMIIVPIDYQSLRIMKVFVSTTKMLSAAANIVGLSIYGCLLAAYIVWFTIEYNSRDDEHG